MTSTRNDMCEAQNSMLHGAETVERSQDPDLTATVTTTAERILAVGDWLMAAHLRRAEVRRAWARPHGAAALDCGTLFSAIRVPEHVVHAAVRTDEPTQVAVTLVRMLEGGPVIRDPQGHRYYALVPASTARRWKAHTTTALGRGAHLVIPRPDAVEPHPVAAYWAVPMPSAGALCDPTILADFVEQGLTRLAEGAPPDVVTMRATVARVLAFDRPVPRHTDLNLAVDLMTGHYAVLLPEVERLAEQQAYGAALYGARSTVGEARARLNTSPGPTLQSATARAQGLARTLAELCDHYERLTAVDSPQL